VAAFVPDALLDHEWSLLIGGQLKTLNIMLG
jgi:hypothetical protein